MSDVGAVPHLKPNSAFAPAERTRSRPQRPLCQGAFFRLTQALHPHRTAPYTPYPPTARPTDARLRVDAAVRAAHQPAHAPLQAGAQVLRHALEQQHPPVPVRHAGIQGGRAAARVGTRLLVVGVVWPGPCRFTRPPRVSHPVIQPANTCMLLHSAPCVLRMTNPVALHPCALAPPPAAHA